MYSIFYKSVGGTGK